MAGDWIRMRTWLPRDPKLISMAAYLAHDERFIAWVLAPSGGRGKASAEDVVTHHVTVALCVTGLLVTWGTARERGDRDGVDLVLRHCDLTVIDRISEIPGLGEAMAHVGWAVEEENGSSFSIRLPRIFEENDTPAERHKRQAAERQARRRAKLRGDNPAPIESPGGNGLSSVTRHVTVTTREEESREKTKKKSLRKPQEQTGTDNPPPAAGTVTPASGSATTIKGTQTTDRTTEPPESILGHPEQTEGITTRPRDYLFDAICDVCHLDPSIRGAEVGKVKKTLLAGKPPYSAEEVREFGRRFADLCDWAGRDNRTVPYPHELSKWICYLRQPPERSDPTTLRARQFERRAVRLAQGKGKVDTDGF